MRTIGKTTDSDKGTRASDHPAQLKKQGHETHPHAKMASNAGEHPQSAGKDLRPGLSFSHRHK